MRFFHCCFLLLVAAVAVHASEEIKVEDGVLVLTKDNFANAIAKHEHILVEFYAPWCGHCKALAPEYAKAAGQLNELKSEIKLGKVDATTEGNLAEEYGVRGYPTLKFFRAGSPIDYSGGRQAADIVTWVQKKTGPPAKHLTSVEEAEKFISESKICVIGFFNDLDSEEAAIFTKTAGALDSIPFAITNDKEAIFAKYEAKPNSVILFKPFDEKRAVYEGALTVEDLKVFAELYSLPTIVEFSHESASKIFGGAIKTHLLFFISKKAGHYEKYIEPLKLLAAKHRKDILFVTIDADEEDHGRIFEFFGMTKEEAPTFRLIQLDEEMKKFKPDNVQDLTPEYVGEFLDNFFAKKLKQHLLSQDLPADWDAKPVKVLVSSNFDSIVMDVGKDVLVEFYAPWCGHCKQLAPIYDQLGEKFENNADVVIAKMDATVNELEHTKVSSFPTIKLYRKGDNKVIEYNLDRTLEDLTKFVESGGKIEQPAADIEESAEEEEVVETPEEQAKDEL